MSQKPDTLIRTKLHLPFVRPDLVDRPALKARVADGLRHPLTLVTAPAGFGKTTLVAASVAGCGMPVGWLSLDRDDNRTGRFLTGLVAALREADPALGEEAAELLANAPQVPPEAVLTSLVNDLVAARRETALVLDDYQFIHSQAVHDAVAFWLAHAPPTFHLVIATRSDPPLPLARLRARGQVVELRAADLGFTSREAAQFLNDVCGLGLDDGAVAVLEARTEGWIAGLQMAALSMRGRDDVAGFIQAFAGTHRFIMDFMVEEVLARETAEVRAFLLQTSILSRLCGPLCDAVTGGADGQAMLETLERRSLFVVPLDDARRWYRYHHLFADLLRSRLQDAFEDSGAIPRLFLRAAAWCEREGQVPDAVGYALAARDDDRAGALIARYWWRTAIDGEVEMVWSWLNALPEDVIRLSLPLSTAVCWMLWLSGRTGAIEPHLEDAERAFARLTGPDLAGPSVQPLERQGPAAERQGLPAERQGLPAERQGLPAERQGLPAELAGLRCFVLRYRGEYDAAVRYAERALDLLGLSTAPPGQRPLSRMAAQLGGTVTVALASACEGAGDLARAVDAYHEAIRLSHVAGSATGLAITFRLVGALRVLGRLRAAGTACREALAHVEAQGMARLPAAGILHVALAEVLVEENDLASAEAELALGFELGRRSGRLDAAKNACYPLSRLRQARGDAAGALAAFDDAEAATVEVVSPLGRAELLAFKARVLVQQGRADEAARCVDEAAALAGPDRGQTGALVTLAAARVACARRAPSGAAAYLTPLLAEAEAAGRWGVALELRLLRSLVLARRGDTPGALADLENALALAEPEGYARIFLDEGPPVQGLLAQWLSHATPGPLHDYAARLLSGFRQAPPDGEPLGVRAAASAASPTPGPVPGAPLLVEALTERELEVLRLIALGMTNRAVAGKLFVAPGTVKAHTSSIYRKLDVANRTEAVARARQLGLIA